MRTGFSQELLALVTLADLGASGVVASNRHQHLFIGFHGCYENRQQIFLAMEYIEHGDLSAEGYGTTQDAKVLAVRDYSENITPRNKNSD